jgi:glycosyltransferase involved in cell wall biosynthesis
VTRWLLHGNYPCLPGDPSLQGVGSGYGVQLGILGEILAGLYGRENIAISAFHGLSGFTSFPEHGGGWRGMRVYPVGQDNYGGDIVGMHATHFGADIVFALMDNWALHHQTLLGKNHVAWTPVDTDNPEVPAQGLGLHDTNRLLQNPGTVVLTMSRFGYDVMLLAKERLLLPNRVLYLPHMIATDVYRPLDPSTRKTVREGLKVDDRFAVLTVAANRDKSRKNYAHMARAVLRALKQCPDLVWILHTEESNPRGHNLPLMFDRIGLPKTAYRFSAQYLMAAGLIGADLVAGTMSAADVGYQASLAEGFGLPNAEEMSCGTPVITTRGSAMTEVVGPAGWLVKSQPHWATGHEAYWREPDHDALVRALAEAYSRGKAYQAKKAAARPRILEHYAVDVVRDTHLMPVLGELHKHFGIEDDRRVTIAA